MKKVKIQTCILLVIGIAAMVFQVVLISRQQKATAAEALGTYYTFIWTAAMEERDGAAEWPAYVDSLSDAKLQAACRNIVVLPRVEGVEMQELAYLNVGKRRLRLLTGGAIISLREGADVDFPHSKVDATEE